MYIWRRINSTYENRMLKIVPPPACEILQDVSWGQRPRRWRGRTAPSGRTRRRRGARRTGWRSSCGGSRPPHRTPRAACPSWSRSSCPLRAQPVSRPSLHVLLHFTCRDSEQGQKSHSERSKMRVLPETLAGVLLVTFCKYIIVYINVDKYLESRSYKNTMKVL